jgi:hypothetical protein
VLGLIAKTQQGVEILGELGWESVLGPNGNPEGLCVPLNLQGFLTVRRIYQGKLQSLNVLIVSCHDCRFEIGNTHPLYQILLSYHRLLLMMTSAQISCGTLGI